MESLLATYASSDDEEEDPKPIHFQNSIPSKPLISSSSSFSILPNPKSEPTTIDDEHLKPSSSVFSSMPKPNSQSYSKPAKRVVQFRPPIIPKPASSSDDDEDEKEKDRKRRKESDFVLKSSSKNSYPFILPTPINSSQFGSLGSASGSGRRSILDVEPTNVTETVNEQITVNNEVGYDQSDGNYVGFVGYEMGHDGSNSYGGGYEMGHDGSNSYGGGYEMGQDGSNSYGGYGDYYGGDGLGGGSEAVAVPETAMFQSESDQFRVLRKKKGKYEIPTEVIEVTQDELTKNRPREDQVKSTGIAFGPAYQPASTKGKPLKLHKRKHQIGSLYFDMRQKEMELTERRSKGYLTKAQTQAKYGW
ncbi:uncharacterized protein LOC126670106 [Mercurialis annua]|uniref:uncharacterized protein LOC126670106 n=1 Tax=Mercurialis annua TaxID=3986 RepID=UPI00215E3668|nr:uncharacterized protein LOC126670106 [Mercurialis annua]